MASNGENNEETQTEMFDLEDHYGITILVCECFMKFVIKVNKPVSDIFHIVINISTTERIVKHDVVWINRKVGHFIYI